MVAKDYPGAGAFLPPDTPSLRSMAEAAAGCKGCDLFERACHVVFGSGNPHAPIMLVGEQPGDAEDKQGKPFVGPAGRILERALGHARIPSESTYVTNAVKHFRWRPAPAGGKRRIHERPDTWQVRACEPWLIAEIERVDPRVIVTLGATAGLALFGSSFRVNTQRGQALPWTLPGTNGSQSSDRGRGFDVIATIHPSAVLRARDRDSAFQGLVRDLVVVRERVGDS